ncbi:C2H2-type domain-containing protein [Caenorhabditis elegans]|uniref:C2H2-type domain-containing protein n=1 Tax=Caenorhabditis elegans TaxID=6239 RepID=Q23662_CAEEL|nr:C2H2-type domain-containing protein [Caenorhabditis elegans]CAA85499.1 C2H2-type domain-containing protein [Caenorhabditis elegans]|eukprot:NP_509593.1 Uncharacterized protein CELE_ZK899.6 [Caenorhabditis elegans]
MTPVTSIPHRIFDIWRTPININTCRSFLNIHKLQCSDCSSKFDSEIPFIQHIDECLENAKRDLNYHMHMHGNRLLMMTQRVSELYEASECKKCGMCMERFNEEAKVIIHSKQCTNYKSEYSTFIQNSKALFGNMLTSYDSLCNLFQYFETDERIIQIREDLKQPLPEGVIPNLEPVGPDLHFDELSEYFIEKYQDYMIDVSNMIDVVFVRYLIKKQKDERTGSIVYSFPTKRMSRSIDHMEDATDTETSDVSEDEQVEESDWDEYDSDKLDDGEEDINNEGMEIVYAADQEVNEESFEFEDFDEEMIDVETM